MKLNVLGTEYDVSYRKRDGDEKLEDADGYTEPYSKKIVIEDIVPNSKTVENIEKYKMRVLRHEIVHAFLIESGMDVEWANNEEVVDWIAMQIPKMEACMRNADAL